MKILVDEDLSPALRHLFAEKGDDVRSVQFMGWRSLQNGPLLDAAEREGFDIIITGDKSMRGQQDWNKRTIEYIPVAQNWARDPEAQRDLLARVDQFRP